MAKSHFFSVAEHASPVDHALPLPAWAQVGRNLRALIEAGGTPGERLPSEAELSEIYEVSRITVRQALAQLVDEGYVARQQGRGTFITDTSGIVEHNLRLTSPWRERPEHLGHSATSVEVERAEDRAVRLDLTKFGKGQELGQRFFWFKRLHLVDNMPIGIVESWVPAARAEGLLEIPLIEGSLSRTLTDKFGYDLDKSEMILSITDLTPAEYELLDAYPGDKAFLVEECFRLRGELIMLSRTVWHGSKVKFRL